MTMQTTDLVVRKTVTVEAPQEHAFDVFTAGFDKWWPRSHHIGEADMAEAVIECREGGRAYERGVDGSECEWGRVLVFDRPNRVVVSWHLQGDWSYDPDPEKATEVEVTFTAVEDGTLVELEHRGFEKHGETGVKMRDAVSAPGGWTDLLEMYSKAV